MKGEITFCCSDEKLNKGFEWAKKRALKYSHEGDPVGDWYEAALPGRNAFCMRDVAHHANGAQILGLSGHTKNMLLRFAQSIAESRDFCCFWEIDKQYRPAPIDYKSDKDFWYNLPANFDVLDACYRMYRLTGDRDYVDSVDFNHFYDLTVTKYIEKWDKNGDGIPERAAASSRKGIPSYEEGCATDADIMSDLPSAQARAFYSYSEIQRIKGNIAAAEKYKTEADRIVHVINTEWWNEEKNVFYFARLPDGTMKQIDFPREYLAYFDVINNEKRLKGFLDGLQRQGEKGVIVEVMSHLSEIFYMHGEKERGTYWLRRIVDPKLKRRDYPEVSFAAAGDYIFGLMGLSADCRTKSITCSGLLPEGITFAQAKNIPLFGGTVDLNISNGKTTFLNGTGEAVFFNDEEVQSAK
ncbi:MAG: hypothetical protein WCN92_02650 [Eubacteriales bacterium]